MYGPNGWIIVISITLEAGDINIFPVLYLRGKRHAVPVRVTFTCFFLDIPLEQGYIPGNGDVLFKTGSETAAVKYRAVGFIAQDDLTAQPLGIGHFNPEVIIIFVTSIKTDNGLVGCKSVCRAVITGFQRCGGSQKARIATQHGTKKKGQNAE